MLERIDSVCPTIISGNTVAVPVEIVTPPVGSEEELILGIRLYRDELPTSASIVPLAFPLIAGAGTMTSLISLRAEYEVQNIIAAICINVVLVYAVLKTTKQIEKLLGQTGIAVKTKKWSIYLQNPTHLQAIRQAPG